MSEGYLFARARGLLQPILNLVTHIKEIEENAPGTVPPDILEGADEAAQALSALEAAIVELGSYEIQRDAYEKTANAWRTAFYDMKSNLEIISGRKREEEG